QPEPGVAQNDDDGVAGIAPFRPRNAAIMREKGDFLEFFDFRSFADAAADDRAMSAGVDDESRFDAFAVCQLHRRARGIIELNRSDGCFLADLDPLRGSISKKQQIEIGTLDLKRSVIRLRQVAIETKRVSDLAIAGDEFGAVFRMELARLELRGDAEAVEEVVVVREER